MFNRPSYTVSWLGQRNFSWSIQSTRILNVFPSWRLQWVTVLSMFIRGITAVDWHILLSCYITLFWLRVYSTYFCPGNVMTHQNYVSALKRNCNVMVSFSPNKPRTSRKDHASISWRQEEASLSFSLGITQGKGQRSWSNYSIHCFLPKEKIQNFLFCILCIDNLTVIFFEA